MNSFVTAALDNRGIRTLTEKGGETFTSSSNPCVDLFFQVGALRGQGTDRLYRLFESAFQQNEEYALRILLWARDVRGGAGERQIFRDVLRFIEQNHPEKLALLVRHVPTFGRWDDLLVFETAEAKALAYQTISNALNNGDGLAAKWMPRKGKIAVELREYMGLTPKRYRKLLVNLTKVVETPMCAKDWQSINFEHVPSLAMTRYTKAFRRNAQELFDAYVSSVQSGEKKVNVGAIYPYDIVRNMIGVDNWGYSQKTAAKQEINLWVEQWNALPSFLGEHNALPLVDVSGSMWSSCGGNLRCIDVSVSLGLYLADKQQGPFKDLVLTFSESPEFVHLKGNIYQKTQQIATAHWGMTTDIEKAFRKILNLAKLNSVKPEDMPRYLVIISDMEFDSCTRGTAFETVRGLYDDAGYELPKVVFWNVQSRHDNVPVKYNQKGVALVSGFSPTIFRQVVNAENLNPENMMKQVILQDRYNIFS